MMASMDANRTVAVQPIGIDANHSRECVLRRAFPRGSLSRVNLTHQRRQPDGPLEILHGYLLARLQVLHRGRSRARGRRGGGARRVQHPIRGGFVNQKLLAGVEVLDAEHLLHLERLWRRGRAVGRRGDRRLGVMLRGVLLGGRNVFGGRRLRRVDIGVVRLRSARGLDRGRGREGRGRGRRARRVGFRRRTLIARDRRHRCGELGEIQRAGRGGGRGGRAGISSRPGALDLSRAPILGRADPDALLARQPRRAGGRYLLLRIEELIVRGVLGVHRYGAAAAGARDE